MRWTAISLRKQTDNAGSACDMQEETNMQEPKRMPRISRRTFLRQGVLGLALAGAGAALSGCGGTASSGAASSDAVLRTLRVGFDKSFPPFSYLGDEGDYVGFDIELAEEVCRRNRWLYQPVPMNWDEKDEKLNQGGIDCIWSCFSMTTREDSFAWSVPYFNNSITVLTAAGAGIYSLDGLVGKRVYVQTSSSQAAQMITTFKTLTSTFSNLYMVDDVNLEILLLRKGEADACILDVAAAKYYVSEYPDELYILDKKLSDDQCAVAFRKDDEATAAQVSKTLCAMASDGSLLALGQKWGLADSLCISALQEAPV